MKELTMPNEVYIEEFDIKVRPYLTSDEVIAIGQLMVESANYIEQELVLMVNTLIACTDIPEEDIQDMDIDLMICSGLWDAVSRRIINVSSPWDYVFHEEDMSIAVAKFLNQTLPNMFEQYMNKLPQDDEWNEVIDKLPKSLNDILEIAKKDGNADIIRGALKMGNVAETGDE